MSISVPVTFTPTLAGIWRAIDNEYFSSTRAPHIVPSFIGNVRFGAGNLEGLVMTSWAHSPGAQQVIPVNIAILAQQPDGLLRLVHDAVPSHATSGGGSVLVADFNGDGREDVFLAAHNETPFQAMPSTVLFGNAAGGFDKVTLGDAVMAHHAAVVRVGGETAVITSTFSPGHPTYQWNGSGFTMTFGQQRGHATSMSVQMADFDGDGDEEIVLGGFTGGPGYQWEPSNKGMIGIYSWANGNISGTAPLAVITPYFNTHPQYATYESFFGVGNTHTYRLWVDDFNHDGRPDILAGQSMWNPNKPDYPSVLQMLQNEGNFTFTDRTNTLNASYDLTGDEVDYSMQMVDLDGSGIDSYLMGGNFWAHAVDRQPNYLLVNDGTGKLHVALHDEFVQMAATVRAFLAPQFSDRSELLVTSYGGAKFHGYLTADGKLNYLAQVDAFKDVNGTSAGNNLVLVNVPLQFDLRTDFTRAITIEDRNGSSLIRTFAGNDIIHQANAASQAHIDGGLGLDKVVYTGARASYTVTVGATSTTVQGNGILDTLVNVERLQFADESLALDITGNAGMAYRLYKAAFDRLPDIPGLGYQMNDLDIGVSLRQVASNFIASPEFQSTYGYVSDSQFVTLLYRNVLDREPEPDGLAYHVARLANPEVSRADILIGFSESPENKANVIGQIENGMVYIW